MKRPLLLLAVPVTFLICAPVFAAGAPVNFSGLWKLNRAKTDASPANTPKKMSMKIEQDGNDMSVRYYVTDGLGDHDWGSHYTLDGKTNHNSWNGFEVKTSQQWAADSLAVNVRRGTSQYKETWSLSADGKTLTIVRHTIFARSDLTETFVYDKQ
jgi:hypothetical protein